MYEGCFSTLNIAFLILFQCNVNVIVFHFISFCIFAGGLASVIYTDTLQTVVLIAGAIVVTSMCKDLLL